MIDAGLFNVMKGKGQPIARDPEAGNPHIGKLSAQGRSTPLTKLENGELLM